MQVELKSRFPNVEVPYETDSNNKSLTSQYNICLAIPIGRKQLMWFTYEPGGSNNIAYLTDAAGTRFTESSYSANTYTLSLGTIISGTIVKIASEETEATEETMETSYFVINDIYMYKGISTKSMTFGERLHYMVQLLETVKTSQHILCLPYMCAVTGSPELMRDPIFYDAVITKAAYASHHIQFRSSAHILPYLNHNYNKQVFVLDKRAPAPTLDVEKFSNRIARTDLNYRAAHALGQATFMVMADLQDDIYHLYADTDTNESKTDEAVQEDKYTYVDIAFVATRGDSVMLNNVFRNIRENANVELGEESEDEDMFQNVRPDKYVDLKKQVPMNCVFNPKWRKWVPINVEVNEQKCVKISQLIQAKQEPEKQPEKQLKKHNNYKPRPVVDMRPHKKPYIRA